MRTVWREPVPKHVRAAVYNRCRDNDGSLCCEDCGIHCHPELHHLRYWTDDDEPIHGLETTGDLAALCRECHLERHLDPNGNFWRDPQELAECWGYDMA
jgi:hypothetical protein